MAENQNALTVQRQKIKTIRELLEKQKPEIMKVLPRHLTADAMLRTVYTTLGSNEKLADCTPESLLRAVMLASQVGLLPDGISGQSYFIPYKNKDKGYALEVQFQLGYKGQLELCRRSGQVARVECNVVYARDHFEYAFGLNPKLDFVPCEETDRGEKKFVYALVVLKDGSPYYDVWSVNRVNAHRQQYSQQPNGKAWTGSWDSMASKTVLNHVLKFCPMSLEYQRMAALDQMADMGISQNLGVELLTPGTVPMIAESSEVEDGPKSKLDAIVEQEAAKKSEPRVELDQPEPSTGERQSACSDELYASLVDTVEAAKEILPAADVQKIIATFTGPDRTKEQLPDKDVKLLIKQLADKSAKAAK